MKSLFFGIAALLVGLPAQSETVYLIYKASIYDSWGVSVSIHSLPMPSIDSCEEVGAELISSKRFEFRDGKDVFECVTAR